METAPLILTLGLDEHSFAFFDEKRRRYFPPERNFIPAHITLFHHLPGDEEHAVMRDLDEVAQRSMEIGLKVMGLRFLGRGVAYDLHSPAFDSLRAALSRRWEPWLTKQDRQRIKPHVTVQNKVTPDEAKRVHKELEAAFTPFIVLGQRLDLWRYLGGPWEKVASCPFSGTETPPILSGAKGP